MSPVEAQQIILQMTGRKEGASSDEIFAISVPRHKDTIFYELKRFIIAGKVIQKNSRWYKNE
jgi:hypothetical protein